MPGFLLKAKNFVGKAAKNYAKDKVAGQVEQSAADNGMKTVATLASRVITGKIVLAGAAGMFLFAAFTLLLVDSSNYDSTFGAVGGFNSSDSSGNGSGTITSSTEVGNIVINCALEQIGKPYVWGAEGPDSFDCSGLVKYCYAEAGISLAHYTETILSTAHNSSDWEASSLYDTYKAYPGDILYKYGHAGIVKEVDSDGTVISFVHAPSQGSLVRDTDSFSAESFTEVFHYVG